MWGDVFAALLPVSGLCCPGCTFRLGCTSQNWSPWSRDSMGGYGGPGGPTTSNMTPSIFGNGGVPDLRVAGSEKSVNSVHRVLRAFKTSYRQARYLASVARSRWFADTQRTFDQISGDRAWDYSTELERERYQRVLARVAGVGGNGTWGRALELGC